MSERSEILDVLNRDLVGPHGAEDEVIESRPTDMYLTGILWPQTEQAEIRAEEDDDRNGVDDDEGAPGEAIVMSSLNKPSLMGLSFALSGDAPKLSISGSAGRYQRRWLKDGDLVETEGGRAEERWIREHIPLSADIEIQDCLQSLPAAPGLGWRIRGLRLGNGKWQATVILCNEQEGGQSRPELEQACVFQTQFEVRTLEGEFEPRSRRSVGETEAHSTALIYRDVGEWAAGHNCSATWDVEGNGRIVATDWLPAQLVPSVSPVGDRCFVDEANKVFGDETFPFDAGHLADAQDGTELRRLLMVVPSAYKKWLTVEEGRIGELENRTELDAGQAATARTHVKVARSAAERMAAGVDALSDPHAELAFRLSMRAMALQRRWSSGESLRWRPFQLGFFLLSLRSLVSPAEENGQPSADRLTMDLLWFPTGGGKTEAYLALSAFVLFYRRVKGAAGGVDVLMRYTLRMLTSQQFERAARLVMACEYLRVTGAFGTPEGPPFRIGMWVGGDATPNCIKDAVNSSLARKKAKQLVKCPCCGSSKLSWQIDAAGTTVTCPEPNCELGKQVSEFPIDTIDEEIYASPPSLLIGTVDKFAQIARKAQTAALLGVGASPPELIIQDELHLISGPLGTVTGLFEAAVDIICTKDGVPPKVIGSTATIRRAEEQVRQLFDRCVMQFPPQVLNAENSCFAKVDTKLPGRLYVGVSSVGRSPKFTLQATCASLMQAAYELDCRDEDRDPFWTLVAYFNSLRELGGALVLMQDDVNDSISTYARLHGTERRPRTGDAPLELTSRVTQDEIPRHIASLQVSYPNQRRSAVLATNMISVGIDIDRLGLMVVNGQPKSMAEYIQATSRVGRQLTPGLIVTAYNSGRPRDRSHYETFRTWHQALYRDVEAMSVTPYASRSRDRSLSAVIVAIARHCVAGMADSPKMSDTQRHDLQSVLDRLARRVEKADLNEAPELEREALDFVDEWFSRARLNSYWTDSKPNSSLLVSLEEIAVAEATYGVWRHPARGAPNSMRNVEPGVRLRMVDHGLRYSGDAARTEGEE